MRIAPRVFLVALLAVGLAGCATPRDDTTSPAAQPSSDDVVEARPLAAWIDGGRSIALLTWGSSSCPPVVADVTAEGQRVTVAFAEPDAPACTEDFRARATLVTSPDGVDPRAETLVIVADATEEIVIPEDAARETAVGTPTEYEPSAARLDADTVALLTWGSSTCVPEVVEVVAATVTFADLGARPCTMDMAPRLTFATGDGLGDEARLELIGGGIDGAVDVAR